jgi:hypothetical protein
MPCGHNLVLDFPAIPSTIDHVQQPDGKLKGRDVRLSSVAPPLVCFANASQMIFLTLSAANHGQHTNPKVLLGCSQCSRRVLLPDKAGVVQLDSSNATATAGGKIKAIFQWAFAGSKLLLCTVKAAQCAECGQHIAPKHALHVPNQLLQPCGTSLGLISTATAIVGRLCRPTGRTLRHLQRRFPCLTVRHRLSKPHVMVPQISSILSAVLSHRMLASLRDPVSCLHMVRGDLRIISCWHRAERLATAR